VIVFGVLSLACIGLVIKSFLKPELWVETGMAYDNINLGWNKSKLKKLAFEGP